MITSKHSVEKVLIERVLKAIIQILYDKGLFDSYDNADEFFEKLIVVRRKPDLNPLRMQSTP